MQFESWYNFNNFTISDNVFSLIFPPMISVRQYHRLHYYITEKIFFCIPTFDDAAPCKQRNCRSSFSVYRSRAKKKRTREDDSRATDEGRLFSQATINTLPNARLAPNMPLSSSQRLLTHLWNSRCHTFCRAPIITTLYELRGPQRSPCPC